MKIQTLIKRGPVAVRKYLDQLHQRESQLYSESETVKEYAAKAFCPIKVGEIVQVDPTENHRRYWFRVSRISLHDRNNTVYWYASGPKVTRAGRVTGSRGSVTQEKYEVTRSE